MTDFETKAIELLTKIHDALHTRNMTTPAPRPVSAAASGPVYRFPKPKAGQPVRRGDDWYTNALRDNVNDPDKARWRDDTLAHLNDVLALNGLPPEPSGAPAEEDIAF